MRDRIKKVSQLLRREKADALLVWNSERGGQPATEWLSGFSGTSSILLIAAGKRFLITDGRYLAQSKAQAPACELFFASAEHPFERILRRLFKRHGTARVLFDGSTTAYGTVEKARSAFPDIVFSSRNGFLQNCREIKEKGELKILSEAAAVACRAFRKFLPRIRPGMTERELARMLEALCVSEGAEGIAFPTIVASGRNGALPHASPTGKRVEKGELVVIDFGVRYNGYVSDMTRTIAVAPVSPRLLRMYEAVRVAQDLGCKKARAGITGQALDAACRHHLSKKGYGKYFVHSTGHGIGMEVHELPVAAPGEAGKNTLPPGSVITCEPGVYIAGVGGVRIEDTLVLTAKGNINLTAAISRELFVINAR